MAGEAADGQYRRPRRRWADWSKMNDWNQYTVIARGGTLMHIVNGQLMAVMVDDDPDVIEQSVGAFRD